MPRGWALHQRHIVRSAFGGSESFFLKHRAAIEVSSHTRKAALMTFLSYLVISLGTGDQLCYIPGMLDTTPALLSTVRLRKQGEEYLVVDVDLGTETLELLSMAENRKLIQGVQLSAIHELVEGPPIYL